MKEYKKLLYVKSIGTFDDHYQVSFNCSFLYAALYCVHHSITSLELQISPRKLLHKRRKQHIKSVFIKIQDCGGRGNCPML